MAFRDDAEAMRARIRALEAELEAAREAMDASEDQATMRARITALQAELQAAREEASKEQEVVEERNRALEQELEEARQALKRAEWRALGAHDDGDAEEIPTASDDAELDHALPVAEDTWLSRQPEWVWQLAVAFGAVLLLLFVAYVMWTGGLD